MKPHFISWEVVQEAVKYLVSGGDGDHLPYTDANGKPNHRLMGAAWAALHGGYRGNRYEGPNKASAISKLRGVYKSEKMDTPQESHQLIGEFFEESLSKDDSFDGIRMKLQQAINAKIMSGEDMDGDDDGPQDAAEGQYAWVADVFPEYVVYCMGDCMFQCPYSIGQDGVELGTPEEVELAYVPAKEDGGLMDKPTESFRFKHDGSMSLKESAYDSTKGKLTIRVIESGFNKSGARYYPAATLKRDHKIFEGAKMFADHQTESEQKNRPEGSVNNWVGQIGKVWMEGDTVMGEAQVVDPQFKAKLDLLNEKGLLGEMGVSIRAIGEAREAEVDGKKTAVVESLLQSRSVDFVTYAGAGGRVEAIESDRNDENDVDLVTESALRTKRPDIVALIESSAKESAMKSMEQQLKEAQDALAAANQRAVAAESKLQEAETQAKKSQAAVEVGKLVSESKLPEAAQARIKKQFAEALSAEGVKEAIAAEQEYIKSLGAPAVQVRKNMGAAENGTATTESESKTKPNLEEAFKLFPGLSEAEVKLAASR